MSTARGLQWLACILLLHCAYSIYEHLSQLKAIGKPQDRVPRDIIIECILSLGIFLISTVWDAPPLAEISWASEMKKRNIDEMDSRLSFASVNHRGTKFFGQS